MYIGKTLVKVTAEKIPPEILKFNQKTIEHILSHSSSHNTKRAPELLQWVIDA